MGNGIAIRLAHLTKHYERIVAVDDLSLSVPAGCIFGFIGPNGAGKSTTIGCMTGLLDSTSGEVELLGERFTRDAAALKRRIGVMPEGLALFEQLRADEFLYFQARIFGLDKPTARSRVDELLAVFELTASRQRLADFSTGMRKKVAFAAAVIHAPELLFLDEPFESMDPTTVAMIKNWLRRYASEGRTVFMTSHVLDTVERFCDRAAIIKDGRLSWEADIAGRTDFEYQGQPFASLEDLFLHITGRRSTTLEWL